MPLVQQLHSLALHRVETASGAVSYRQSGHGSALVLLHGIGSASGSWLHQLEGLTAQLHVLAWDAPGYGQSTHLVAAQPQATDYAQRLWEWLDTLPLNLARLTLVGHSLGALMAAAAAGQRPDRVGRLVLLSPALGYGMAPAPVREAKRNDRLALLERLGPAGMARERGAVMLSAQAKPEQISHVQHLMAAIDPKGYTQATHMLANEDLRRLLASVRCPVEVACGSADTITPPSACEALARDFGVPCASLGPVGHACAIEAPDAVNALLLGQPT
jgi:pimeloyl-ACP methyl ester carboxylesterase